MLQFLFFIVLINTVLTKNEDYIGYKVYNIKLHNESQQDDLYKLKSDIIDYWRKPCAKYNVVGKAMVPPSHTAWFEGVLAEMGVETDVFIADVFSYLTEKDNMSRSIEDNENNENITFDFNRYHRYNVILDYLHVLEERFSNSSTSVEVIEYGQTEENRPLVYIKLANGENKPVVVIEAAINPRDWLTVAAAMNIVESLLDGNTSYLDDAVWIVVPVVNPDGYEYTHTNLRLWTKSRSLRSNLGIICPGVHLDRNFDIDWLISDSSSSPCSHLYAGIQPFSEIETQMMSHIIEEYRPRLYISLQNSGRFITYPWRFEKAASGLFRRHYLKGLEVAEVLEGYTLDSAAIATGDRESGSSVDFARLRSVVYTFGIGVGDGEVVTPEEEIRQWVDDVWRAVAVASRNIGIN